MLSLMQAVAFATLLSSYALAIPATTAPLTATPTYGNLPLDNVKAIVPTASGQIGINPVDSDLGDASSYSGHIIGVDTQYLSEYFTTDPSVTTSIISGTKWLASDSKYLDASSGTVVAVSTAAADGNGLSAGDISLTFSKSVALAVHESANAAIKVCNAVSKRDIGGEVMTCLMKQAKKAAKDGFLEKFIQSQVLEKWGLKIAQGAAALAEGLAGLATSEMAQAIVLLTAAAVLIGKMELGEKAPNALGKIVQPKNGFGGTVTKKKECNGNEKKGPESPLCVDDDCQGLKNEVCTTGPEKNCPCLLMATPQPYQQGSWAFLVAQRDFLNSIISQTTTAADCTITSVSMTLSGWNGPPVMVNCICGPKMVQTQQAVSGTVTTTLCKTGGYSVSAPPGYTNIGGPTKASSVITNVPTYRTSTICNHPPNILSDWPQDLSMPCQTFTYSGSSGFNTAKV